MVAVSCKTPFLFMTTAEKIAAAKKRVAELELLIKLWSKKCKNLLKRKIMMKLNFKQLGIAYNMARKMKLKKIR